jgi:hypothetical protein
LFAVLPWGFFGGQALNFDLGKLIQFLHGAQPGSLADADLEALVELLRNGQPRAAGVTRIIQLFLPDRESDLMTGSARGHPLWGWKSSLDRLLAFSRSS